MKSKSGATKRNNYIKACIFYWWLIKTFFFGLLGLVLLMQSWPQNTLFHHWLLLLSLDQHMTNIHRLAGIKCPITGPISCLLIHFTFILLIKNGSSTVWILQRLTKILRHNMLKSMKLIGRADLRLFQNLQEWYRQSLTLLSC